MTEALQHVWTILSTPLTLGGISFGFSMARLLLEFVLPFFVGIIVLRFIRVTLVRLIERSKMQDENKKTIFRATRLVFRVLGFVYTGMLLVIFLGAEFVSVFNALGSILNEPFYRSGDLSISIMTILTAIPVFYLASWAGKGARTLVESEVLRRLRVDESQRFSIANITRYAVMLLVTIVGLTMIGINLSSLLVIFSVLGIGIGFGLQNMVANFFAGLTIIITRPIKEGDFILTNGIEERLEGQVVRITLLHSVINTLLNETIIIPNSIIVSTAVHNYSYNTPEIIVPVIVQVHYESDLDQVEQILIEVGKESPHWNRKAEPMVRVRDFASSGIEVGLFCPIRRADQRVIAMALMRKAIWRKFKEAGVVIPYPQLDLYIKEGSLPPQV